MSTKRAADRYLTKDDDLDNVTTDVTAPAGSAKASAETMAGRRIVKAKLPASTVAPPPRTSLPPLNNDTTTNRGGDDENDANDAQTDLQSSKRSRRDDNDAAPTQNPFANIQLATTTENSTVFGFATAQGFGHAAASTGSTFGFATAKGFGEAGTGGFGGLSGGFRGFGTSAVIPKDTPKPNGLFVFGATSKAAATNEDPEAESDKEDVEAEVSPVNHEPVVVLPKDYQVTTGEEDELVLFEQRSRTFRFDYKKEEDGAVESPTPASQLQVAASKALDVQSAPTPTATEQSTSESQPVADTAGVDATDPASPVAAAPAEKKQWIEVGLGPVKVLQHSQYPHQVRIVQRRQAADTSSHGTKLLLNLPIRRESSISKPSEKHVQLRTLVGADGADAPEGETTSTKAVIWIVLLKFKNSEHCDELFNLLQTTIQKAKSIQASANENAADADNAESSAEPTTSPKSPLQTTSIQPSANENAADADTGEPSAEPATSSESPAGDE
jgi:NUP50 (Nucleoporin 50 kDa)